MSAPMLSRVADHLYWMSRYTERAEHMARLLDVNLYSRLDQHSGGEDRRWPMVLRSLGIPPTALGTSDPLEVVQLLTFDRDSPYSIVSNVSLARSNAREVREQISSEMWEQMNRLYLYVHATRPTAPSDTRTYDFLQQIRRGSHLFHGIASSTMSRGDGWSFIQLGRYLERVLGTVTLLDEHLKSRAPDGTERRDTDDYVEWANLLRSCTALEAYFRTHTANILPERGAAFLLLDPDFPHSVRFGMHMVRESLEKLSNSAPQLRKSQVHRRVGKLLSTLRFDVIEEIVARDMHQFLGEIRKRCIEVHGAVYLACISYPVDQALAG